MVFSDHFLVQLYVIPIAMIILVFPIYGQIITPCTPSMISTFTPCLGLLTNSTSNGNTSPTSGCCDSLKSITSSGKDCLCLIVTGNIPFNLPINRTLAISLPRACNMPGVPLQCKAIGAPVPAPGPIALGPTLSPESPLSPSPKAFEPTPSSEAPESDTTPLLTPSSQGVETVTPTATTTNRSVLTPSSATSCCLVSPSVVFVTLGFVVLKYY